MHSSSFLLAATLASLAAAQDKPVVSAFLPMADAQDLVASVVAVEDSVTTVAFGCPDGADSNDCGFPPEGDYTAYSGPSTIGYTIKWPGFSGQSDCKVDGDVADCVVINSSGDTSRTDTTPVEGYTSYYLPVTVTAGAELLSAGADATPTPTGTDGEPTDASDDAPEETGTGTGTGSDNAGPRQTQAPILAAAALVAGALLI